MLEDHPLLSSSFSFFSSIYVLCTGNYPFGLPFNVPFEEVVYVDCLIGSSCFGVSVFSATFVGGGMSRFVIRFW